MRNQGFLGGEGFRSSTVSPTWIVWDEREHVKSPSRRTKVGCDPEPGQAHEPGKHRLQAQSNRVAPRKWPENLRRAFRTFVRAEGADFVAEHVKTGQAESRIFCKGLSQQATGYSPTATHFFSPFPKMLAESQLAGSDSVTASCCHQLQLQCGLGRPFFPPGTF